jgi:hypothetical protein
MSNDKVDKRGLLLRVISGHLLLHAPFLLNKLNSLTWTSQNQTGKISKYKKQIANKSQKTMKNKVSKQFEIFKILPL